MSRAMLVAAGAALLGGAECEQSVAPPYGVPPPTPDAGADTAGAATATKAADSNVPDDDGGAEGS